MVGVRNQSGSSSKRRTGNRLAALAIVILLSLGNPWDACALSRMPRVTEEEEAAEARKKDTSYPLLPVPEIVRDGLRKTKTRLWASGNQAMESGRTAEAIERFREIVAVDPRDPKARSDLGVALARSGDRAGAVEQYREALRMAPENAGVHYNLGVVLAEAGSEEEAIEHLQAAVKSDAQMTRAHFQLANLLMRRGGTRRHRASTRRWCAWSRATGLRA